jgi:hypothetical protein
MSAVNTVFIALLDYIFFHSAITIVNAPIKASETLPSATENCAMVFIFIPPLAVRKTKKLRRFDNTMVNAATLSLMKIYRMSLILAGSISLDSTFKKTSHSNFSQRHLSSQYRL